MALANGPNGPNGPSVHQAPCAKPWGYVGSRHQPNGQPGLRVRQGPWPLFSNPPQCNSPLGKDLNDGNDGNANQTASLVKGVAVGSLAADKQQASCVRQFLLGEGSDDDGDG